ncbi:MAG: hypothetical protein U0166_17035 [Acidobacteriota bacterium]
MDTEATGTRRCHATVCLGLVLSLLALPALAEEDEREDEDVAERRNEWFYGTRGLLGPGVNLEVLAAQRLRAATETIARTRAMGRIPFGGAWRNIGPAPINGPNTPHRPYAGRIEGVVFDPVDPNTLYVCAASGGFWKSTDGGLSWSCLSDGLPTQSMGSAAISTTNGSEIWLGTGEPNPNPSYPYFGAGIFHSTDGGITWAARNGSGGTAMPLGYINAISLHPTNGGELLVGGSAVQNGNGTSQGGIWRSTDAGATWTKVYDKNPWGILRDGSNPSVLFAARRGDTANPTDIGVIKSTDGGVTWIDSALGISTTGGANALSRAPTDPQTFYFMDGGSHDVYKSTDGAATWTRTATAVGGGANNYALCIAVDPANASTVYAGDVSGRRSLDGGVTWTGYANFLHLDEQNITYNPLDPTTQYWGTDGGLYKRGPGGDFNLNGDLSITQLYDVGIHPTDDAIALAGSQDNGFLGYSGNPAWDLLENGTGPDLDTMVCIIDPVNPNYCYGAHQGARPPFVYRSSTGASGPYTLITGPITENAAWVTPYVLDPNDTATIYLGTNRVWRSTDHGTTWAPVSPVLGTGFVRAIAVAPSNSNVVYAAQGATFFRTTDAGANWTDIASNMGKGTIDIAVDPEDADHVVVVQPTYIAPTIYFTTNGGGSWTSVTNGLPAVPAACVTIATDPYRVYVGTDVGVFVSMSDSGPYVPDMNGFPQGVAVSDIEHNVNTGTLSAATYGRGVFQKSAFVPYNVLVGKGAASGASYDARVNAYRADGTSITQIDFLAYAAGDRGVNTAGADLTGDGWAEIVTGQGPGATNPPTGRAFDSTGLPLANASWSAYGGSGFGLNVAPGNIDGDRYDEVLTGPGEGPVYGPQVRAWNYDNSGAVTAIAKVNYYAYGTLKFGVNVASGNLDADGYDEIITGAGPGDVFGPHVRGWQYDNAGVSAIAKVSFFAYNTLKYGVNPGAGDVEKDGFDEIVTGPGPGAVFGAQVRGFNVDGGVATAISKINFVAYASYRYGVNAASGDVDGDRFAEIVTGPGPDPAASADLRGFDYDGNVVGAIPAMSVDVWPGLTYGATVSPSLMGY